MHGNRVIPLILTTLSITIFGRIFIVNAIKQARYKRANMDTLVALSITIAFIFSLFNFIFPHILENKGFASNLYFEGVAGIITFILIGRYLEERARHSTKGAIEKLYRLIPSRIQTIKNNSVIIKEIENVIVGDLIIVEKGERIPVDGIVKEGETEVDESMLTGESYLIRKVEGAKVYAGTINISDRFIFEAQGVGAETKLNQIISLVEKAQGSKASYQRLADKIASIFVLVILGIASISFIAWMLFGGEEKMTLALLSLVNVLVIACPCSLGLATPTAIMVGMGIGANRGILIKDAQSLELLHDVKSIAFDKTGTLTEGNISEKGKKDNVKTSAIEVIKKLQHRGIEIVMLSGDKEDICRNIAYQCNIKKFYFALQPDDKERIIRELQKEHKYVAMVGDGINDSAALASADVSIAISSGSDIAMDTSQITLVGNDMNKLEQAITLSDKTIKTIKSNLFWAFFYNIIAIPIAAGVLYPINGFLLNPMIASAAMALSSVCVVCNSLLLRYRVK